MKYGAYFAYWESEWDADYLRYCEKLSKLGFDILEVGAAGIYSMSDEKLAALKKEAKAANITLTSCVGFPKAFDVASSDASVRAAGMTYAKKIIENLDKCDCRMLSGIIYSYWPYNYGDPFNKKEMFDHAADSMREMADFAAKYGVQLNCEVVNRFEHPLLNCSQEAVEFVKVVDRPNVKVLLDAFHMNIEEDSFHDAIVGCGKYLGHFHIGETNRKVPGKGKMPWNEIGAALREINYTGGVVMEPFVKLGGGVGLDIKVWRDLSGNADEAKLDSDIQEALRFTKAKFEG